jgi:neopullulanase
MTTRLTIHLLFLLIFGSIGSAQTTPEATKVEPPNWWAGHSINPVRILIRGRNLEDARVSALGGGISITSRPRVNAGATYLLVDVSITRQARPGARKLRITTPRGIVDAPFEISPELARAGRFQGLTVDDVVYLIMPDRFCNGDTSNDEPPRSRGLLDRSRPRYYHGGDLRGVITRLPYLKELGVTALWLNPIYDNNDRLNEKEVYEGKPITDYHGYGAVDFYAVEEHFGDLSTLRELVDKAHGLGIKIVQDQVANHTGPYHPWVKDPPTPTWFNGTERDHINETWQTWTLQDPHATVEIQRPVLDGWFINLLPDLNQSDPEVRRYIIQNTLWWLGVSGFDAIRQDTLPYVPRSFWRDWTSAIKREYPKVNVVGETYDGDPAMVAFFQGGARRFDGVDSGIDTEFDFPLFYAIRSSFANGKEIKPLAQTLAHDHLYPDSSVLVTFLGLHDMLRFMNESGATPEGLKLAQTFLMTTRGTPLIYYGDEIAMPGGGDPDNRRDFPGGFPGDLKNAFTREGRTEVESDVWNHLQRVVRLRAELEALRRGRLVTLAVSDYQYAFARTTSTDAVIVAFNNSKEASVIELEIGPLKLRNAATLVDRLGVVADVRVAGKRLKIQLPPRSAVILVQK